jgi:hypothetical protein
VPRATGKPLARAGRHKKLYISKYTLPLSICSGAFFTVNIDIKECIKYNVNNVSVRYQG